MRLLVCGGRTYTDRAAAFAALDRIHAKRPIALIIHGACPVRPSADWLGEEWAVARGVDFQRCAVDHSLDGPWPAAGPRRNRRMRDTYKPDGVLALPGRRGTANMIELANEADIPVWQPYG